MIYLQLFYEFFKIGLFTFGGGYAMIPLVKDTVINNSWLAENEFYDLLGICESTPGPIAVNMATFVGSYEGGILGSIVATLGVILPSFIIILLIAAILKNFIENKYFKSFIKGVKPVVIALISATGLVLLIKCLGYAAGEKFRLNLVSLICFVLIFAIYHITLKVFKKKISAVVLIIISAALGIAVSSVLA